MFLNINIYNCIFITKKKKIKIFIKKIVSFCFLLFKTNTNTNNNNNNKND